MSLINKPFLTTMGYIFCLFIIQQAQAFDVEKLASGLKSPWGMAFVSDDKILITQKSGQLRLLEVSTGRMDTLKAEVPVSDDGQGGLLDVAVMPGFQSGDWIYFTYSKQVESNQKTSAETCLARAKLSLKRQSLYDWQELFVSQSGSTTGRHFGSRIAFNASDRHNGFVFFSVGDRGVRENGQNRLTHAGSIIRLNLDGSIPQSNPYVNNPKALDEIWSYGHRNPQGLAWDNKHNRLWAVEHGPRGGDELNLILPGKNYGWAKVSYGKEYWGPIAVGEATRLPGIEDPYKVYVPSIAPGSLLLYSGKAFKQWRGQLLIGALKLQHINKLELDVAGNVVSEKRLLKDLKQRIRALIEGPDGLIYFSTDSGNIYRLVPSV